VAPRVLVFAGSARRESLNKKLARVAAREAEAAGGQVTFIDLDDFPMPVYHGDLEAAEGMPANGVRLRGIFIAHDALIVVSPENNQSMPSLLKNTIDWLSRDIGDGKGANNGLAPFRGKVAALMAASPGIYGGIRGLPHLRQSLSSLGVLVIGPQVGLARADRAFDESGALIDAGATRSVKNVVASLIATGRKLVAEAPLPAE
jgi:chromate reductase, NAD(P)H dehydrogenase (quinone)